MSQEKSRLHALDALRGFAIFGILLINIQVFSGWGFIGPEGREALSMSQCDASIDRWLDVLVRAKFYSLFALLFGYSFTMMAQRVGQGAMAMHLKRMAGLLIIGLAHSLLLWPWDILVLYSIMGLLLTPFLGRSTALLLCAGISLFGIVWLLHWQADALGLQLGRSAYSIGVLQDSVPAMASGSYRDVLQANLWLSLGVAMEWLQGLRPLRVLGLFLLGAAAACMGLARPDARRLWLWLAAAVGFSLGLPLALAEHELIGSGEEGLVMSAQIFAPPLLAIAYAAALMLFWQGRWWLARGTVWLLAPAGRMALTNYLLQSAICVPLFYGFGLGLFAEWSLTRQMLFTLALFAGQLLLSHLWLSLFKQGPMEALWRRMIGRRKSRSESTPS
jgi:uncharacterized protein